jgi:hypothetical protein
MWVDKQNQKSQGLNQQNVMSSHLHIYDHDDISNCDNSQLEKTIETTFVVSNKGS